MAIIFRRVAEVVRNKDIRHFAKRLLRIRLQRARSRIGHKHSANKAASRPAIVVLADGSAFSNAAMIRYYQGLGINQFIVPAENGKIEIAPEVQALPGIDLRVLPYGNGQIALILSGLIQTELNTAWCMIAKDGDYLAYPFYEERTIPDLCQFLFDERRRSFFTIQLDMYCDPESGQETYVPGQSGWRCDRYGYRVHENHHLNTHIWEGGFTQRFEKLFAGQEHRDLTRIAIVQGDPLMQFSDDLRTLQPRRYNRPVCEYHLTPTGCIFADRNWRRWLAWYRTLPQDERVIARAQLLSAPFLSVESKSESLIEAGLMNRGQWF